MWAAAFLNSYDNQYSIPELTKPFQATSNLIGMKFMKIFKLQGVRSLNEEAIHQSARDYLKHITQA
jgi:glutathione-regulated potassium-efflux system ancillary protein KefG